MKGAVLFTVRALSIIACVSCWFFGVGGSPTFPSAAYRGGGAIQSSPIPPEDKSVFLVGEELRYNVSYASINIGQIRIRIVEKDSADGRDRYRSIAYIDSYSGIPFVNVHTVYESIVDETVFSHWFRSRVKEDSRWYATTYDFDYSQRKIVIKGFWWGNEQLEKRDSIGLDTLYQDGLSLYYLARHNVRSVKRTVIPTMIRDEKVRTIINFSNRRTSAEIDAVRYPIDVVEFDGNAEFVGIFGLTGEFQGWFSNDDARVPILAKMKVIIGNVRIELMKWSRPGWNPPEYSESAR